MKRNLLASIQTLAFVFLTSYTQAQLSGTYSIDGSGSGNYLSFTDAVNALTTQGVSGPVVFNVADGLYNEQIVVPAIPGANAVNTITFQSASGDSTKSVLSYQPDYTNPYIVKLKNANYLTFKELTIQNTDTVWGNIIELDSSCNYNQFLNNIIQVPFKSLKPTSQHILVSISNNATDTGNVFSGNYFHNGVYGIYAYHKSGLLRQLTVSNNIFSGILYEPIFFNGVNHSSVSYNAMINCFGGLYATYSSYLNVEGNRIKPVSHGYRAIVFRIVNGSMSEYSTIINNIIDVSGSDVGESKAATGINVDASNYIKIEFNSVIITQKRVDYPGTSFAFITANSNNIKLMNNNFINAGGGYAFFNDKSTFTTRDYNNYFSAGEYILFDAKYYTNITAYIAASSFDQHTTSLNPLMDNWLKPANLGLNGTGTTASGVTTDINGNSRNATTPDVGAYEWDAPAINAMLTRFVALSEPACGMNVDVDVELYNAGSTDITTAAIEWELNGVAQTPFSFSGTITEGNKQTITLGSLSLSGGANYQVKAWIQSVNGNADPIADYDTLYTNGVRYPALAGTYTIGGTTPDFSTVKDAVEALNIRGVCGPVTFDIRNGTYIGQLSFGRIAGASAVNIITFQSESGDNDDVLITYDNPFFIHPNQWVITFNENNFLVGLNGTDYVMFKNISFKADNSAMPYHDFSRVFWLYNNASFITIDGCELVNSSPVGNSFSDAAIYIGSGHNDGLSVRNNRIKAGAGVVFHSYIDNEKIRSKGVFIINNDLNVVGDGIRVSEADSVIIDHNKVEGNLPAWDVRGIYIRNLAGTVHITNNWVLKSTGTYGIFAYKIQDAKSNDFIIANNFIHLNSYNSFFKFYNKSVGIGLDYCWFPKIYNNSVHITQSDSASVTAALKLGSVISQIEIKNNIFANSGKGYAVYIENNNSLANVSDYNDYYSANNHPVAWRTGTIFNTLTEWKTANASTDIHSHSIDPMFATDYDLHICQQELDSAGTPLNYVSVDIDSTARNATHPDIGADEFSYPPSGALAAINLGVDFSGCSSGNYTLDAGTQSIPVGYQWSNGAYTQTITIGPEAGTFVVKVSNGCEAKYDTLVYTLNDPVKPFNVNDTNGCIGSNIVLDASNNGSSYLWSTGSTTQSIAVSATDTVWVSVNNGQCTITDSIRLQFNPVPVVNLGNDTAICNACTVILDAANPGATYLWNTGTTTQTIVGVPGNTYAVTVTNNGCEATDTIKVEPKIITGIENSSSATIRLYPNPTEGQLHIQFEQAFNGLVLVENPEGQQVYKSILAGIKNHVLHLETLPPGIYFVRIAEPQVNFYQKLILLQR